jgi:hypothetical protein
MTHDVSDNASRTKPRSNPINAETAMMTTKE